MEPIHLNILFRIFLIFECPKNNFLLVKLSTTARGDILNCCVWANNHPTSGPSKSLVTFTRPLLLMSKPRMNPAIAFGGKSPRLDMSVDTAECVGGLTRGPTTGNIYQNHSTSRSFSGVGILETTALSFDVPSKVYYTVILTATLDPEQN